MQKPTLDTISDVEAWARDHGGLEAVKEALARGVFGNNAQSIRTAIRYVEREELKIAERLNKENRRGRGAMSRANVQNGTCRTVRRGVG